MKQGLTFIYALAFSATSIGLEISSNANVLIVESLDIAETSELDFGKISNLNGTCTMSSDGSLSASNGQNCAGSSTPGEFLISGSDGQTVTISVTSSETIDGVSFSPTVDGSTNKTLVDGSTTVSIVGSLTLSDASSGSKAIPYTVTTNYQ